MFIYIDESGSFVLAPSENSWNVIAAYAVPESNRKHCEAALRKLKISTGYSYDNEIKLKNLTESQISDFLDSLASLEAVVFASCIDLGMQDIESVSAHQASQVEKIRVNKSRMIYEEGRALIDDLANRVESLPAQLYTQMVVQVDLLDQVYRSSTLYFAQRIPATLSSFRWRIDEKNSSRPVFEETLRYMAPPLLQSRSIQEPAIFVHDFDYRHYEKSFRYDPENIPKYLQEVTGNKLKSGSNLGKILKDFVFVRSHDVPGVQIADILSSTFRRVLRGEFNNNIAIAKRLGRLTVQRSKPNPPIHLISLSEYQYANGNAADMVRVIKKNARAMLR